MVDKTNAYKLLVRKPENKRPIVWRPKRRFKGNIILKTDVADRE